MEGQIPIVSAREKYISSVEIGTAKNGALKVYFDASNPNEARTLVENAQKTLAYARQLMEATEVQ